MSIDEAKSKLDALSPEAKRWLHRSCDQMAACGEYIPDKPASDQCLKAGVLTRDDEETIEVDATVFGLVYSNDYLRAFADR